MTCFIDQIYTRPTLLLLLLLRYTVLSDGKVQFCFLFSGPVSASREPPGGQSVVLKCEVSEVNGDPVTLAWLRMEGRTGVVVKQDILTESQPNWTLSVTLPSLHRDQLDWRCVVFREDMLRASVPLRLRGAGGRSGLPGLVLPSPLKGY